MRFIVLPLILVGTGIVLGVGCEPTGNYARLAQGPDDGGGQGGTLQPDSGSGGLGDVGGSGVVVASGGVTAVGSGGQATAAGGAGGHMSASSGAGGHASGAAGNAGGTSGLTPGSGGQPAVGTGGAAGGRAPGGTGGSASGSGGVTAGSGGTTSAGGSAGRPAIGGSPGGATSSGGNGGAGGRRMLSVDFVGGVAAGGAGGVTGTVVMAATEIAGVKPARNWNSAAGPVGSLSTLALSDGSTASGAHVSWNAPLYAGSAGTYAIGYADAPGDVRMMNGCLNPGWTGTLPTTPVAVVSFMGLPAAIISGGYDVYVYVLGGIPDSETRLYQYTIGATTFNVTQGGPTPTTASSPYAYVLAPDAGSGNYIVFRNVTGAAFDLQVEPGSSTTTMRSPINGIQIVWPAGS